jgi:hypothetical protein
MDCAGEVSPTKRKRLLWRFIVAVLLIGLVAIGWEVLQTVRAFQSSDQCAFTACHFLSAIRAELKSKGALPPDFIAKTSRRLVPPGNRTGLIYSSSDGTLIDCWKNPLDIQISFENGAATVRVTNAGRDGVLGTKDDFTYEQCGPAVLDTTDASN